MISLNPDLKKLWDEGYDLQVVAQSVLLVKNVPYLNDKKELQRGVLVSQLSLNGDKTIKPETHVAYFIGEYPCDVQGKHLRMIVQKDRRELVSGVTYDCTMSAKDDYTDHYEKITRYLKHLCNPVEQLFPDVGAKTYEFIEYDSEDSVFQYVDTNSSRAMIHPITAKLSGQKIGIVGLGGTGSYILDFIAKCPVDEIHLFDGDNFLQHNAFRAPWATPKSVFFEHLKKTDYYKSQYSNMHRHIHSHPYALTSSNIQELDNMSFVFLAIDPSDDKAAILKYLEEKNIPFIHCGISLTEIDQKIKGQIKTTTRVKDGGNNYSKWISNVKQDNIYDQNIQIAELNAMNAVFAVIKWKKLFGVYHDLEQEMYQSYTIYTNETINEDIQS